MRLSCLFTPLVTLTPSRIKTLTLSQTLSLPCRRRRYSSRPLQKMNNEDPLRHSLSSITAAVTAQGDVVRSLKSDPKSPKSDIAVALAELEKLKIEQGAAARRLQAALKNSSGGDMEAMRSAVNNVLERRFFYMPSFKIYGGVAGFYDFGPPGCAIKSNVLAFWRQHFILEEGMLEVDCPCVTPEVVLKASGHVEKFTDLMVNDVKTGHCYRADHLLKDFCLNSIPSPNLIPFYFLFFNRRICEDSLPPFSPTSPPSSTSSAASLIEAFNCCRNSKVFDMENKGHQIHGNCIEISHFDYSVDNYMKSIDSIRELCGLPLDQSFDSCEVERFSSMIMFLIEWKYFVYKPRSIMFQYETSGQVKGAFDGINIPQFSSAAVPKMEQPSNGAKNLCSDFVLHAGGLVWAMDWCPSNFESFDSEYKCEYLAISAHPPGSAYHKIGVPVTGRGIIQIWCLLTLKESMEFSSPNQRKPDGKPKGKPKGKPSGKPRGRPKGAKTKQRFSEEKSALVQYFSPKDDPIQKNPKEVTFEQYFSAEEKEDPSYNLFEKENLTAKKPMGRPTRSCRKQYLSTAMNKNSEVSAGDLVLFNSDSSDANRNAEELISMCKGIYSAQTVLNPDDHVPVCESSLPTIAELSCNFELNQPKQRGEPNVKTVSNTEVQDQQLGSGAGNDEINLPIFGDNDTISEVIKLLKLRSKNRHNASKNKCVQTSVAQIDESLHVSGETFPITIAVQHEDTNTLEFEEHSSSLRIPAVTDYKMDLVLPTHIGQPIKQQISGMKEPVSTSGSEVVGSTENQTVENKCERGEACLVKLCEDVNNGLSENKRTLRADRMFGICYSRKAKGSTTCRKKRRLEDKAENSNALAITTVQPEDHCHSEMVLSNARSHETFHILKDTALPKVVLCLAHNGKVAWDVKWRPISIIKSEKKHSLGYLAALLGDGSLIVWEVPLPNLVNIIHTSHGTDGTDPRFMKLQPVFKCFKVMRGDRQCIPLTMEWSTSAPHDLILAGCHDGTVAIWKFSKQSGTQDIKPLLCFSADNVPIRSLAWAPNESDVESANIIVTAGHEGIKFWDIRDPYRPLWEYNPIQKIILSLQWLPNPRCLVMSFDDGFIRILSLWKVANDFLATGEPLGTSKQIGLHNWCCSQFAIWNCQVSRATDVAAYCTADGYTRYFKLTTKAVEKDSNRYREPHYLSSLFGKDETTLKIGTPLFRVPVPNIPLKKVPTEMSDIPLYCHIEAIKQASGGKIERRRSRSLASHQKHDPNRQAERTTVIIDINEKPEKKHEELPPKEVAIHRLRWNLNKGSEKWLCSGGAAGVVRCQKIDYI